MIYVEDTPYTIYSLPENATLLLKKCSDLPAIDILYFTPSMIFVSVKLLVNVSLIFIKPFVLSPAVKEILLPVVSPSGDGAVQIKRGRVTMRNKLRVGGG